MMNGNVVPYSSRSLPEGGSATARLVTWQLASGDIGMAFSEPDYCYRSFQVDGEFSKQSGGLTFEASNDGKTYYPIATVDNPGIGLVLQQPFRFVRPRADAG